MRANTNTITASQTLAAAISTRNTAIDDLVDDFDDFYDLLDPDAADFNDDLGALIAERDGDAIEALNTFDVTFCGNAASKIFRANSNRQALTIVNDTNKELSLYIDTATVGVLETAISTRNTAVLVAFSDYDAAVALLDPDDGDYATDLAALRTTRDAAADTANSTYDTARAAADDNLKRYTYVAASGGRYDTPINFFDGPIWGALAASPTGTAIATETLR